MDNTKIVLGIGAHPDDLDFMASGSMAKLTADGADVYYLILTNGSKGTANMAVTPKELTAIRQREQRRACKILGIKEVFFLEYEDGALEVTMPLKRDIVKYIRKLKPDTVFAMDPSMLYDVEHTFINHPDHRAGGQAVMDAVYPLARDHLSFPEQCAAGLEPHEVKTLLLTNFAKQNYYVDITDTFDIKLEALAAHASQVADLQAAHQWVRSFAEEAGQLAGVRYAEGFMRLDVEA